MFFFTFFVMVNAQQCACKDVVPNQKLRDYLLSDYDKYTRPNNDTVMLRNNATVTFTRVYFTLYLMWLSELDCSASNFQGNFYLIFEWNDPRLIFPEKVFGKGFTTTKGTGQVRGHYHVSFR